MMKGGAPASRMAESCTALLAFAVLLLIAACEKVSETKLDDERYRADGDTWVYSKTEVHTSYMALNSPHGMFGRRSGYRERHLMRNSAGKTISIPDHLYALQRDGTMRKIECCQYSRERGHLYNFDDKLVFIFDNARKFITDCFIYPRERPNNESQPPGEQIYGVTVFAEFDPEATVFKIRTFDAGDNYLPFEYRAAVLRTGRTDLTIPQDYEFRYARRKPFMCEDPAPPPTPSARLALDMNAYQYGATRTIQISVAPAASGPFVDQLQIFALQKGFKSWQAGTLAANDISLALQGEEILMIAAATEPGRWRVACYRRKAEPPSGLPSEASVSALLRELRSELAKLPGVIFSLEDPSTPQ